MILRRKVLELLIFQWKINGKYFLRGIFFSSYTYVFLIILQAVTWVLQRINVLLICFSPVFHFYTPKKRQKTFGFLTILAGIETEDWAKWVKDDLQLLSQSAFTCSKLTIETLKQCVKNMFNVNNKNTRATSMTPFWCLYC